MSWYNKQAQIKQPQLGEDLLKEDKVKGLHDQALQLSHKITDAKAAIISGNVMVGQQILNDAEQMLQQIIFNMAALQNV